MSARSRLPAHVDIGSGKARKHAPIAGDDYVPPLPAQPKVATPARKMDPEALDREIHRLEAIDKKVEPSFFQISVPGAGSSLEFVEKLMFKAVNSVLSRLVKKAVEVKNKSADNAPVQEQAKEQKAKEQKINENKKSLRDAIDAHDRYVKEPRVRAAEQSAIDKAEQRERIGDNSSVA